MIYIVLLLILIFINSGTIVNLMLIPRIAKDEDILSLLKAEEGLGFEIINFKNFYISITRSYLFPYYISFDKGKSYLIFRYSKAAKLIKKEYNY